MASPGVLLTRSDAAETVFELSTPSYTLESVAGVAGDCQRLRVDGWGEAGATGAPQVPVKVVLLGVPPQADLSVEVQPLESVVLPGRYTLCPAPEPVAEEGDNGVVRYVERDVAPDAEVYSRDSNFPEALASLHDLGFMRSQRLARVEVAPFQYNPVTGALTYYPRLRVSVRYDGAVTAQRAQAPVQEPPVFERSLRAQLLNYEAARGWRSRPLMAASNHGWLPPAPAYRLAVSEEGMYAVSYSELAAAGLPVDQIDPAKFRIFVDGQEIAIRIVNAAGEDNRDGSFDEGDRVLFYGRGADDKYTDTNIYWLTYGATSGVHMVTKPIDIDYSVPQVTDYAETIVSEENFNYVSAAPMQSGYEHWYGRQLSVFGADNSAGKSYALNVSALASGAYSATLEIAVASRTRGDHHLKLYVNDTLVHETTWNGSNYHITSGRFDQALLREGANIVTLEIVNDLPRQTVSVAYVDWMRLTYQRRLTAIDDGLIFESPGGGSWRYTIDGFTSNAVELYDVTNPARVSRVNAGASNGTLSFGAIESDTRRYLILTPQAWRSVKSITPAHPENLLSTDNGADYLIIAHGNFLSAIQPLADHRARQGYRVKVIDVQHIYDLFSYGRVSVQAIQDFLAYAYYNWAGDPPSFVLLVGDGTYDPRQYRDDSAPTYIPPYLEMVDPDLGETAADNRYVAVAGDDTMPDMNLGRFPVNSAAEVTAMVQKTLRYESVTIQDDWNRNVLFITDDLSNGGGAFYNFSDAVAEGTIERGSKTVPLLPRDYRKMKAYLGRDCQVEDCKRTLVDVMNSGALLVSYVGHSAKENWAAEQLMNIPMLSQLNNADRLPIMLPMTCLEGYYQQADGATLAESIVRLPRNGAVASWSATGLGLVTGHDYLEKGLFIALFYDGVTELGAATTAGKLYLLAHAPVGKYDDLLDTFTLLGDPALHVRLPGSEPAEVNYSTYLPTVIR